MRISKSSLWLINILVVSVLLTACSKNSGDDNVDIYIAGFDNGKIVYWKNGQKTELATVTFYNGNAYAIAVSGSDVYVAGYVEQTAVYWKNGVRNDLSSSQSRANAIVVNGADLYVGGYENGAQNNSAVYWKNGT